MSLLNQEPLQITDEKLNKILDLLAELRLELDPIVSALTGKQKRRMLIMGNRAYPFVKKTILYCRTNPEFSPRYFDSTKLELDFTAFEQLSKLSKLMLPLTQLVIDTETICGNRAYKASLLYYSSVQEGAKRNIPDAKPILEDLSLHFKKTKRKTDSSNDTEGSENHDTTS